MRVNRVNAQAFFQSSKNLRHISVQKNNVKFRSWEELRPKFIKDPWSPPPITRLANPHAWKERLAQRVDEKVEFPGKAYPPEKKYRRRVYTRILTKSHFVLMQQILPLFEIRRALRGKVRLTMIKTSLLPLKELNIEGLKGMVSGGPILFAYPIPERNREEFLLEDIRLLLSVDPDNRTLMTLGGLVQGQIIGQSLLERLRTLKTIDEVRSELISLLLIPQRNIIQTLRAPTSQLVKVFQHRATASPSDPSASPSDSSSPSTPSPDTPSSSSDKK